MQLAIRSGDYYMFDDLDDDDVTDLIPDSDIEKKEKERRREQERLGRRMTVSEVSEIERLHMYNTWKPFCFFKDSNMNLSDYAVKCRYKQGFFVKILH